MPEIKLSPVQRRVMEHLAESVERMTRSDRNFFRRRPDRQHRVRLACKAEVSQNALLDGRHLELPPGYRVFTLVRNLAPGVRFRIFTVRLEDAETDLDEESARALYEACSTASHREHESHVRAALGLGT